MRELTRFVTPAVLFASLYALSGCRVVGGIFKAGVWSGIIVAVVLVLIVGGISAMLRQRGPRGGAP